MRGTWQGLGALATALALVVACNSDDEPTCYAGDSEACTCPGTTEQRGYRACDVLRSPYGACVCDGTVGAVDASAPAEAGAEAGIDAGKAGLFASCTSDADCESGLCREYPSKGGLLCTKACTGATAATDCPPPATGCNNQGICKAP